MKKDFDIKDALSKRLDSTQAIGPFLGDEFQEIFKEVFFHLRIYSTNNQLPNFNSHREIRAFMRRCHKGWKRAQALCLIKLLDLIELREGLEGKISEFHIQKKHVEKEDAKKILSQVKMQTIVLRRAIDHIAWTILKGEPSSIRRLALQGGENNFSKANILDALSTVNEINKDPNKMAVMCDATTFIHIGDILVSDIKTGQNTFIELKKGEKNMALTKAAYDMHDTPELVEQYKAKLNNTKDINHFERAKRQVDRGLAVQENLNHGRGKDNFTGGNFQLRETSILKDSFSSTIVECREELEEKTWAISMVDDCLYVGMYRDLNKGALTFVGWTEALACDYPVVNITESFLNPQSTPLTGIDLPTNLIELIQKVVDELKIKPRSRGVFC